MRELVPLWIFLMIALHFSFKIMVLFHAADRVGIKKNKGVSIIASLKQDCRGIFCAQIVQTE